MGAHPGIQVRAVTARSIVVLLAAAQPGWDSDAGQTFLTRFDHRPDRGIPGPDGDPFNISYADPDGKYDGPVEWCLPVSDASVEAILAEHPDLRFRAEAAHDEAWIPLGAGGNAAADARHALTEWAGRTGHTPTGPPRLITPRDPATSPRCASIPLR